MDVPEVESFASFSHLNIVPLLLTGDYLPRTYMHVPIEPKYNKKHSLST